MPKIEIFDPPQCCSTGVCGPKVDKKLVRFAADLDWLAKNGAVVERFNLAQQPDAFMGSDAVREKLVIEGNGCLPLVVVDGEIVSSGRYPDRGELAGLAQVGMENGEEAVHQTASQPCCPPTIENEAGCGCAPSDPSSSGKGCC